MTKLLTRFIHPTTAQALKVLAWAVALANVPLTIGATITGVPAFLTWLTPYWPGVFALAGIIHQTASTFGVAPDAGLAAALDKARMDGVVAGAKEMLTQMSASTPVNPSPSTTLTTGTPLPERGTVTSP